MQDKVDVSCSSPKKNTDVSKPSEHVICICICTWELDYVETLGYAALLVVDAVITFISKLYYFE